MVMALFLDSEFNHQTVLENGNTLKVGWQRTGFEGGTERIMARVVQRDVEA
jgi:hypothetical protein